MGACRPISGPHRTLDGWTRSPEISSAAGRKDTSGSDGTPKLPQMVAWSAFLWLKDRQEDGRCDLHIKPCSNFFFRKRQTRSYTQIQIFTLQICQIMPSTQVIHLMLVEMAFTLLSMSSYSYSILVRYRMSPILEEFLNQWLTINPAAVRLGSND